MKTSNAFTLLDVGAPRTGTQSMYAAMKILGLNPLHSGFEAQYRLGPCNYLFGNGSLDDALGALQGHDSAMDEPFMLLYEEIMSEFSESKFLLTISDGESWFNNYVEMMRHVAVIDVPTFEVLDLALGKEVVQSCTAMASWGCHFVNSTAKQKDPWTPLNPLDAYDLCLKNYYRHIERVQQVIPAQRLLVYNWSDGWAPLCHFLGKPIPDVEFPYEDLAMKVVEMKANAVTSQTEG
eukprot:Skav225247  [mRNA]  locus=scaffold988:13240:15180:- [translate_table: standard]